MNCKQFLLEKRGLLCRLSMAFLGAAAFLLVPSFPSDAAATGNVKVYVFDPGVGAYGAYVDSGDTASVTISCTDNLSLKASTGAGDSSYVSIDTVNAQPQVEINFSIETSDDSTHNENASITVTVPSYGTFTHVITVTSGNKVNEFWQEYVDPATGGSSSGSSKSKSSHKVRNTSSAEYDYKEVDGQLVYGGLVNEKFAATTLIPAEAFPKFNKFLVQKFKGAESGSNLSVQGGPWTSMTKAVADAFTENGQISMTLTYELQGITYELTVPAGSNLSELVDENGYLGFAKLASVYPATPVTE
jgi:hypothetical protein